MQTIVLETEIAAPVERCFLLSLSLDLHQDLASRTQERAVAGRTRGIIGPGETVTWTGRHFGVSLTHESIISGYDRPRYFQDSMLKGVFSTFVHDHFFRSQGAGTLMRDELRFAAPLGALGRLVEKVALRRHMEDFLRDRNRGIARVAESQASVWSVYLQE
jgi:ligand-binding SRPBCC domain-containing protein